MNIAWNVFYNFKMNKVYVINIHTLLIYYISGTHTLLIYYISGKYHTCRCFTMLVLETYL